MSATRPSTSSAFHRHRSGRERGRATSLELSVLLGVIHAIPKPAFATHRHPESIRLGYVGTSFDGWRSRATGDPMMIFKRCALVLSLAASAASGSSCADDIDPEPGPTQGEMQQVAADVCEKDIECGSIPNGVTREECIQNQLGAYQASSECLAVYYFDECRTTQTCEELERLSLLNVGDCLDERDEAFDVQCVR
jgi:hypothetical protein